MVAGTDWRGAFKVTPTGFSTCRGPSLMAQGPPPSVHGLAWTRPRGRAGLRPVGWTDNWFLTTRSQHKERVSLVGLGYRDGGFSLADLPPASLTPSEEGQWPRCESSCGQSHVARNAGPSVQQPLGTESGHNHLREPGRPTLGKPGDNYTPGHLHLSL